MGRKPTPTSRGPDPTASGRRAHCKFNHVASAPPHVHHMLRAHVPPRSLCDSRHIYLKHQHSMPSSSAPANTSSFDTGRERNTQGYLRRSSSEDSSLHPLHHAGCFTLSACWRFHVQMERYSSTILFNCLHPDVTAS